MEKLWKPYLIMMIKETCEIKELKKCTGFLIEYDKDGKVINKTEYLNCEK